MNKILFTLAGLPVTVYALLITVFCLLCAGAVILDFHRRSWPVGGALIFSAAGAVLSLLLGRSVFCAVRYTSMFFDPMGRPTGWGPFFNLAQGNISVAGVLPGCLAAGWIAARLMKKSPLPVLEAVCLPLLLLFSAIRFIEPISGQGYGMAVTSPVLCWQPLSILNGWGGYMLSVSFMEGMLLLSIGVFLLFFRTRHQGTRLLMALLLIGASQLIPESLRRDDALKLFTFARVNQIIFALLFFSACVWAWRRSQGQGKIPMQIIFILACMLLLIGGEFALDKTQWPDGLIYLIMILLTAAMTGLMLRRALIHDRQQALE